MCTALTLKTQDHYFCRNLDLDRSYGEEVVVLPRRAPLSFRCMGDRKAHHAMIGMATVVGGVPLFYDAVNEHGLAMAGLNFPGNASYVLPADGWDNVAPFEFIPWVLGQCRTLAQARALLDRLRLVDIPYSDDLPLSPLHWMIADRQGAIVVETMRDGLHIHENPVGVLTNNPPFEHQLANLERYRHLRNDNAEVTRAEGLSYDAYSQGLGAVGLPGDVSSMSRFVRMAFGRKHSACEGEEGASVNQCFHLLSSVEMIRGLCKSDEGGWDITVYSACINTDRGRYYYTTYDDRRIRCVDMHKTNLESIEICRFPIVTGESSEN